MCQHRKRGFRVTTKFIIVDSIGGSRSNSPKGRCESSAGPATRRTNCPPPLKTPLSLKKDFGRQLLKTFCMMLISKKTNV